MPQDWLLLFITYPMMSLDMIGHRFIVRRFDVTFRTIWHSEIKIPTFQNIFLNILNIFHANNDLG